MTDRTNGGRSVPGGPPRRVVLPGDGRFIIVAAIAIAIVGTLIGGNIYGRFLASRELGGRDTAIEQLQSEAQKLKRMVDDKSAQVTALATKLSSAQAALETIMPKANTYNLMPNQSLIVADGHLTMGLVGSPANEGVTLNINGKEQTVVAGQVIDVAADASSHCQVTVQSFDLFQAVVNASCAGAKPR